MGNGRVRRGLSSGLSLFAISINIILAPVQVESSKLNGGTINLTVTGHAYGFLLVKNASLVVVVDRATGGSFRGGLGGRGCEAAVGGSLGNVLLLSGRNGCGREISRVLTRIPRVGRGARNSIGLWRMRFIFEVLEIRLGEFILGRYKGNLSLDHRGFNVGGRFDDGGNLGLGFSNDWLRLGFGFGWFDDGFRLNGFRSRLRCGSFLRLRRRNLGSSRLSKHAGPCLHCGNGRFRINGRENGLLDGGFLLLGHGLYLGRFGSPSSGLLRRDGQLVIFFVSRAIGGGSSSRATSSAATSSLCSAAAASASL